MKTIKTKLIRLMPFILLGAIIILTGCGSQKDDGYILVDLDETEIDSTYFDQIDAPFEQSDSLELFGLGKGVTWRTWKKLHKQCMKAAWLKRAFYFGVTSTVDLGSIVDKDLTLQRIVDENTFSKDEIAKLFKKGSFANCGYTQEMTLSLKTFIQSEFDFTGDLNSDVNAELSNSIKTSNNTKVKIDSWRINNLIEQNLLDILKDGKDNTGKKRFYETLKKSGNRVLTKVIEVKGFTSEIILETDMSLDLEAKLAEGISASIGNTGMTSEFRFKNKRTIEVVSDGNFYVFGEFKKSKKVN